MKGAFFICPDSINLLSSFRVAGEGLGFGVSEFESSLQMADLDGRLLTYPQMPFLKWNGVCLRSTGLSAIISVPCDGSRCNHERARGTASGLQFHPRCGVVILGWQQSSWRCSRTSKRYHWLRGATMRLDQRDQQFRLSPFLANGRINQQSWLPDAQPANREMKRSGINLAIDLFKLQR